MSTLIEAKRFVQSVSTVNSTAGSTPPAETSHNRYATTAAREQVERRSRDQRGALGRPVRPQKHVEARG